MYNFLSQGPGVNVNTNVALVLGFGPGQTAPPMLLVQNLAAGGTVTLPKINQVPPSPPATPGTTPGVSDGDTLVIRNIVAFTTTIAAASGDTTDVGLTSAVGDVVVLMADSANSKWRSVGPTGSTNQTQTAAGAATLALTSRYMIVSVASTQTIPATWNAQVGQPFTYSDTSSGSLTLTPASGLINTTSSYTLSTLKAATFISNGTDFVLVAD